MPIDSSLYFWAILIGSMLLSGAASLLVRMQFSRGQRIAIASGLTGREVAERILKDADISDVKVVEHQGFLSDHYNPMSKTLALSPEVYNGISAAFAGVAAHEVGHAIQHARAYGPLWMRSILVPVANIGSMLGPWIVIAGAAMGAAQQAAAGKQGLALTVGMIGVALFGAATLFTLVTVPVEFNASSRAKERLVALGITRPGAEDNAVRGVLTAAGLTYVAAAITSIAWLVYYLMQLGLLGRRDD
ncbi:MAG TPA: zinc metallopeptidase [Planctomycetota bacterium]|nr:zinc metallopeptidase [Planctomycetota bacterium]